MRRTGLEHLAGPLILATVAFSPACSSKKTTTAARQNPTAPLPSADTSGNQSVPTSEAGVVTLKILVISAAASAAAANTEAGTAAASTKRGNLLANDDSLALATAMSSSSSATTTPAYVNYAIIAGPPDALALTLTKVELQSSLNPPSTPTISVVPAATGASSVATTCASGYPSPAALASGASIPTTTVDGMASLVLFDNQAGTVLNLVDGKLDPGVVTGTCAQFPVTPSTHSFNLVTLQFRRQAQVSGCLSGNYASRSGGTPNITGAQTYCTRSGYSTYDGVKAQNSDFQQSSVSQTMSFDLAGFQAGGTSLSSPANPQDLITISLPVSPPISITTANQEAPVTVSLDLSRVLRFYNQNGGASQPSGAPAGQSFFYSSTFARALSTFVGSAGHVYGYDVIAEACPTGGYVSTQQICQGQAVGSTTTAQGQSTGFRAIGSWLSVITDSFGAPLVFTLTPNDESDLVLLQGSTAGLDSPYGRGVSPGTADVSYALSYGSAYGKILGLPADLGVSASGSGATAPVVGTQIVGTTFDATAQSPDANAAGEYAGPVFLQVRLSD